MDSPARRRTRVAPRRLPASNRLWVEELESRIALSGMLSTLSHNWSGYAVTAKVGAVSSVSGSWTVPAVSGNGTSYSAAWVGIDGFNSPTVEQIGTASDLVNGTPQYYAWYEMYPSGSVVTSLTISPGDTILGQVTALSPNVFSLTLSNLTTGQGFATTQTAPGAQQSSAEWVVEAPSSTSGILPLANFNSVSFTASQATVNGTSGPIDRPSPSTQAARVTLVAPGTGAAQATASNVSDTSQPGTSSFTVATAPATPSTPTTKKSPTVTVFFLRSPDQVASLSASNAALAANEAATANSRLSAISSFATNATLGSGPMLFSSSSITGGTISPSRAAGVAESGDSDTGTDAANPNPNAPATPPAATQPDAPAGRPVPLAPTTPDSLPAPSSDRAPDAVPRSATEEPGVSDVYFIRVGERTTDDEDVSLSNRAESGNVPVKAVAGVVLALALGLPAFRDPEEEEKARRLRHGR